MSFRRFTLYGGRHLPNKGDFVDVYQAPYFSSHLEEDEQVSVIEELSVLELIHTLEQIAMPKRPDGSWNRGRQACCDLAQKALENYQGEH